MVSHVRKRLLSINTSACELPALTASLVSCSTLPPLQQSNDLAIWATRRCIDWLLFTIHNRLFNDLSLGCNTMQSQWHNVHKMSKREYLPKHDMTFSYYHVGLWKDNICCRYSVAAVYLFVCFMFVYGLGLGYCICCSCQKSGLLVIPFCLLVLPFPLLHRIRTSMLKSQFTSGNK